MKHIKQFFSRALVGLSLLAGLAPPLALVPAVSAADIIKCPVGGATLCVEDGKTQNPTNNGIYGENGIITKAVRLLSFVVGVAAVIAVIIGGFKYVTSSGDSNNINSAKNTILYALIGLVVASAGQAIVIFVLNKL